jgi:MarR family transcriptional regulator, transcriptional regulator for hemolysin
VKPVRTPIGLQLARSSKSISRAFDQALAEADGSLPAWLVLLSLKTGQTSNQRELATSVGIREATLTHHLNAMTAQGLVTRERDPSNRRVHQVKLTDDGEALFLRLRTAAMQFDRTLRNGITESEIASLDDLLHRLERNVADQDPPLS